MEAKTIVRLMAHLSTVVPVFNMKISSCASPRLRKGGEVCATVLPNAEDSRRGP
jgi:hypothetical protein